VRDVAAIDVDDNVMFDRMDAELAGPFDTATVVPGRVVARHDAEMALPIAATQHYHLHLGHAQKARLMGPKGESAQRLRPVYLASLGSFDRLDRVHGALLRSFHRRVRTSYHIVGRTD
jgi:hypothetical protein